MRWADIPNAVVALAWAGLLWMGLAGIASIKAQQVEGYPASGQWMLYVFIPAICVAVATLWAILSRRVSWFRDVYPFAVGLTAFAILPVLFLWSGGV